MKLIIIFFILVTSKILTGCADGSTKKSEIQHTHTSVDICKCLTEPGNSKWAVENKDDCRDAISLELGVKNYEKVNFSKEPEVDKKWNQLVKKCTESNEVKTGAEDIDRNNELMKQIGASYGYIWESINTDSQIYTTLAFDGLKFRTTSYSMNGEKKSENFTKLIDLFGSWNSIDKNNAEGTYELNNVSVNWKFVDDYSTLTNNKGVVFDRIRVK